MKYYIIAGEASGDLHGANLMRAITVREPGAEFRCWGGDMMESAGGKLVRHYRDLAFMGFWEVVKNIRTIWQNIRFCQEDITVCQPDALILVDYPGFNLRMARWAKSKGIPTYYYISPQIWAWHSSRVEQIRRYVDRMLVILPFEQDFYASHHVEVDFVGHPLLDVVKDHEPVDDFLNRNGLDARPIIALLPGSRRQEIERMLPVMIEASHSFPGYQFVVAGAPGQTGEVYAPYLARRDGLKLVYHQTYDLLAHAHAALVTSGTATLETALFDLPQVVCYRGGWVSYRIARLVVNVKYISLVNLIVDRPLIAELIQDECSPPGIAAALQDVLVPERREEIRRGYAELRSKLGERGAAGRAAQVITGRDEG
jgi:lipid-A-disaccharide synthase